MSNNESTTWRDDLKTIHGQYAGSSAWTVLPDSYAWNSWAFGLWYQKRVILDAYLKVNDKERELAGKDTYISQQEMAARLGIKKPHFSVALKELEEGVWTCPICGERHTGFLVKNGRYVSVDKYKAINDHMQRHFIEEPELYLETRNRMIGIESYYEC